MREYFPNIATRIIAAALGRSVPAICNKAQALRLRKSDAFMRAEQSGRIMPGRASPAMASTRFRKGNVPANKGLRRPASEARNYLPIGSEKYDARRGVLMRKMTDDPALHPAARWRPVHTLVWTAAHGPVPPGHLVVFRPGMKTLVAADITLDRLELISLRENMRRNTVHNMPGPLPQLVLLRAALVRKINRLERHRHEKQD